MFRKPLSITFSNIHTTLLYMHVIFVIILQFTCLWRYIKYRFISNHNIVFFISFGQWTANLFITKMQDNDYERLRNSWKIMLREQDSRDSCQCSLCDEKLISLCPPSLSLLCCHFPSLSLTLCVPHCYYVSALPSCSCHTNRAEWGYPIFSAVVFQGCLPPPPPPTPTLTVFGAMMGMPTLLFCRLKAKVTRSKSQSELIMSFLSKAPLMSFLVLRYLLTT